MQLAIRSALMACLALGVAPANAELTPVQLAAELMIESQGDHAFFLCSRFGIPADGLLVFSSYVDPSGTSFQYEVAPGSTYGGQDITISCSGTFDPDTMVCEVQSSGSVGAIEWTASGTDSYVDNGAFLNGTGNIDFDTHDEPQGIIVVRVTDVNTDTGKSANSSWEEDKNGNKVKGSEAASINQFPLAIANPSHWTYEQEVPGLGLAMFSLGSCPPEGGEGTFITSVTAMPVNQDFDFEAPTYAGSPGGVDLEGQDGWYRPSGINLQLFTYAGNGLGFPTHPTGGEQFVGGVSAGGPQSAARAQHDHDFSTTDGWLITYDIAVHYTGQLPAEPNLASVQLQPFSSRSFVSLANFVDPQTCTTWKAEFSVYNADGSPLNNQSPGSAWTGLAVDRWYRIAATVSFATNRVTKLAITDLATDETSEAVVAAWYLGGGAEPGERPRPDAVRLFAGGSPGGTTGYENLRVRPDPVTAVETATELMMECQGDNGWLIGRVLGPSPDDLLSFTSFVDPAGTAFSFESVEGAMYQGQPFSLSGSGTLDPNGGDYLAQATGSLGDIQWSTSTVGLLSRTENSVTDDRYVDWHSDDIPRGIRYVNITKVYNDCTDENEGFETDDNGLVIPHSDFSSFSTFAAAFNPGRWDYEQEASDGTLAVFSEGTSSDIGGPGEFTTTIGGTKDCYPDFTADGQLDLFDFLGYVNAFNANDDIADCDGNGSLDLFDFLCFVNAFNEGC